MFRLLLNFWAQIAKPAQFEVYTDGSSKDGWGSWAFILTQNGQVVSQSSGRVRRAGSNAMEFQGALEALQKLPKDSRATVFSDSRILVDAMTLGDEPQSLSSQISKLKSLSVGKSLMWKWVKSHNGLKFNEQCDLMCREAREIPSRL